MESNKKESTRWKRGKRGILEKGKKGKYYRGKVSNGKDSKEMKRNDNKSLRKNQRNPKNEKKLQKGKYTMGKRRKGKTKKTVWKRKKEEKEKEKIKKKGTTEQMKDSNQRLSPPIKGTNPRFPHTGRNQWEGPFVACLTNHPSGANPGPANHECRKM